MEATAIEFLKGDIVLLEFQRIIEEVSSPNVNFTGKSKKYIIGKEYSYKRDNLQNIKLENINLSKIKANILFILFSFQSIFQF